MDTIAGQLLKDIKKKKNPKYSVDKAEVLMYKDESGKRPVTVANMLAITNQIPEIKHSKCPAYENTLWKPDPNCQENDS